MASGVHLDSAFAGNRRKSCGLLQSLPRGVIQSIWLIPAALSRQASLGKDEASPLPVSPRDRKRTEASACDIPSPSHAQEPQRKILGTTASIAMLLSNPMGNSISMAPKLRREFPVFSRLGSTIPALFATFPDSLSRRHADLQRDGAHAAACENKFRIENYSEVVVERPTLKCSELLEVFRTNSSMLIPYPIGLRLTFPQLPHKIPNFSHKTKYGGAAKCRATHAEPASCRDTKRPHDCRP